MKSLQKVSRIKLEVNQNLDFTLFGILSSEPDYKLSLELNKKFLISLKQISPIKLRDKNDHDLLFSRFSYTDTYSELTYSLISNRTGKRFFINDLKNIDFLFQIQNFKNENNIKLMISDLREIETITAIFDVSINKIKDKNLQYLSQ